MEPVFAMINWWFTMIDHVKRAIFKSKLLNYQRATHGHIISNLLINLKASMCLFSTIMMIWWLFLATGGSCNPNWITCHRQMNFDELCFRSKSTVLSWTQPVKVRCVFRTPSIDNCQEIEGWGWTLNNFASNSSVHQGGLAASNTAKKIKHGWHGFVCLCFFAGCSLLVGRLLIS